MSDLDLPLLPSAEQIRRRKFATVRRGYDPDQVHEYLNQVAEPGRDARDRPARRAHGHAAASRCRARPSTAARAEGDGRRHARGRDAKHESAAYEQIEQAIRHGAAGRRRRGAGADRQGPRRVDEARSTTPASRPTGSASTRRRTPKRRAPRATAELERAREEADRVLGGLEAASRGAARRRCTTCSRGCSRSRRTSRCPTSGPAAPGAHAATPAQATPRSSPKPEPPIAGDAAAAEGATDAAPPARRSRPVPAQAPAPRRRSVRTATESTRISSTRGTRTCGPRPRPGSVDIPDLARSTSTSTTRKLGRRATLARFASLSPDGPVVPGPRWRIDDMARGSRIGSTGSRRATTQVAAEMATPETIARPRPAARRSGKRYAELEEIVRPYRELRAALGAGRRGADQLGRRGATPRWPRTSTRRSRGSTPGPRSSARSSSASSSRRIPTRART